MSNTENVSTMNTILPLWFGENKDEAERRLEMMRKAAEEMNRCLEEGKFPNIDMDENAGPLLLSLKRIVLDIDQPLMPLTQHDREGRKLDA